MTRTCQAPWLPLGLALTLGSVGAATLTTDQILSLPPPTARPVEFKRDIEPILTSSCVKCHARGRAKGGLQIETRETLLRGGDSGAVVVPGQSQASLLIALVAGVDPDEVMPKKGSRLSANQIGLLRAWIDQGLAWDPGITFARSAPLNLLPHSPRLEISMASQTGPIDQILQPYFRTNQFHPESVIDDRLFARRAWLDVIGLLPPGGELESFLTDARPNKRALLVERLLADDQHYAEHWLSFWNDLLRNDYRGTGYIDGGRKQITPWLYSALVTNMPYDRFVAQLVDPTPESEGFSKGIVWRGVVNASQSPPLQTAQNISQVFMGVNLKCASCHDSFINDWRLSDSYGLASIYSDGPLQLFQCDKPTGQTAAARFIYPELGEIDAAVDKPAWPKSSPARRMGGCRALWLTGFGLSSSATASWKLWTTWNNRLGARTCSTGWPRISSLTITTLNTPSPACSHPVLINCRPWIWRERRVLSFAVLGCDGCQPNSFETLLARSPEYGSQKPRSETARIKSVPASWPPIR
jgi:hypothetical protein